MAQSFRRPARNRPEAHHAPIASRRGFSRATAWRTLCLAVAAATLVLSAGSPAAGETVRVGIVLPLTGPFARVGVMVEKGIRYGIDDVNRAGLPGGLRLEAEWGDNASATDATLAALKRFAADPAVVAAIGPTNSTNIVELPASATEPLNLPLIIPTPSHPDLLEDSAWRVRIGTSDRRQAAALVAYVRERFAPGNPLVVWIDNDGYSEGFAEAVRDAYKKVGVDDMGEYRFAHLDQVRSARYQHQLMNLLLRRRPDFVYIGFTGQQLVPLLRLAGRSGLRLRYGGGDGWDSSDVWLGSGQAVEGACFVATYEDPRLNPLSKRFVEFHERADETIDGYSLLAYDSVLVLADALRRAGPDREKLRAALRSVDRLPTAGGELTIGADGEALRIVTIKTVTFDGEEFAPVPVARYSLDNVLTVLEAGKQDGK